MDDLIRRTDVLALAKDVTLKNGAKHRCIDATLVYEIPPAEPVVHCGECKYYPFGKNNKETRPWCKIFVFEEPRYCSYGKRREDAD